MLKKDQVRLMTKLAIMEKNKTNEEKNVEKYYKSDYVYINNWKTRLSVSVVYICFVIGYYFNEIYNNNVNPLSYNIPGLISKVLIGYGIILVLFTMLSSAIYSARYNKVAKNNEEYLELLEQLKQTRGEG
ncbi:hypothetical protein [Vallitalea okinawensis]|uniref:hypothetical protein n=1 Tax=Vallitalea okinawensis TaxID=2078660 RepID=UPI000CFE2264|nr:hypothetical protein [Vallitalea okinawensis]